MPQSPKGGDRSHGNGADDDDDVNAMPPPDEHTRLLPNRVDSSRGMLTPDDPAVTPYNLWSIRLLRWVTVSLALVAFFWWVLVLVSTFATLPGFHVRGGGFYAYAFASLALADVLLTLVFFEVPSRAFRVLSLIMAFVLMLDMIIILAVKQTRYEEGWVGVVSVVWALLMSLWTILVDRTVQWGKAEEEERLTGRAETRRTLGEWLAVLLSSIGAGLMAVAAVLIALTVILRALDAKLAPPGDLHRVDGGTYRIHVYCRGNATTHDGSGNRQPTVLFEGGERPVEDGLWQFADAALDAGSIARYCFADRPGLAWSDAAPSPLSAGFAVDALSEALAAAGERGPWVLASAGIGSLYSRVFSARHGSAVRGILLVDPLHEDLLGPLASPTRGFGLWLRGVLSPLGLDRLPGALFRGRTSGDRVYGRAAHQGAKSLFARLQESLVLGSFTRRDVAAARQIQHRRVPLVVVTSGRHVRDDPHWEAKQRDLTGLTDELLRWDIVDDAPPHIWETEAGRDKMEARLRQLLRNKA
ncbi:integral membrane protein [Cordyceps fumosorosea ARSEF 2679]|uniref:Integral membrane protein n=1 Tax=Cordyceps fumosorosea (strain ARSEF 2679) TaxID=1081104 RepID=A0A162MPD4_CORFA|nr:integral membrane protein [Cordyceps fumosorosea ARSEF 2679]OAA64860.1 integral membrane protein [Cordyceps fumosorosea ARSEF 2679]